MEKFLDCKICVRQYTNEKNNRCFEIKVMIPCDKHKFLNKKYIIPNRIFLYDYLDKNWGTLSTNRKYRFNLEHREYIDETWLDIKRDRQKCIDAIKTVLQDIVNKNSIPENVEYNESGCNISIKYFDNESQDTRSYVIKTIIPSKNELLDKKYVVNSWYLMGNFLNENWGDITPDKKYLFREETKEYSNKTWEDLQKECMERVRIIKNKLRDVIEWNMEINDNI